MHLPFLFFGDGDLTGGKASVYESTEIEMHQTLPYISTSFYSKLLLHIKF